MKDQAYVLKNEDQTDSAVSKEMADVMIMAPVSGITKPLNQVNDQVFSAEIMGQGAAIIPSANQVYAPTSGKVTVVFETHHAYGITSDEVPKY